MAVRRRALDDWFKGVSCFAKHLLMMLIACPSRAGRLENALTVLAREQDS